MSGVLGAILALGLAASILITPAHAAALSTDPFPAVHGTPVDTAAEPTIDIASLLAEREAQLQRRSMAVDVRLAALAAIKAEQERLDKLGYDPATAKTPQEMARQMMDNWYGWGDDQFACYDRIIINESRWRWNADNPHSSAYGIPQALPGSKMASAGADWRTNPATQIKWGLGYVKQRYGTPCSAWGYKRSHGWY